MYEFSEIDLFVAVRVNSEQVPENVVQLSLRSFVKDFNYEGLKLFFFQVGLGSIVILIKVFFKLSPNSFDKSNFFLTDSSNVGNSICFDFLLGSKIKSISEVFFNESSILLEGNETILVSIELLENPDKVSLDWLHSNEEASVCDQINEILEADFFSFPLVSVLIFVFAFEENFNEIDRKNDGDKFFEGNVVLLSWKIEVVLDNVSDFILVKSEDLGENGFNLVNLEDKIFVEIVVEEDSSKLIQNYSDKSIPSWEILEGEEILLIFIEDGCQFFFMFFGLLGGKWLRSEIIPKEKEVDFVADPSVMVKVDFAEQEINLGGWSF